MDTVHADTKLVTANLCKGGPDIIITEIHDVHKVPTCDFGCQVQNDWGKSSQNTAINTNMPMVKNEIIDTQNVECQTQFNCHCINQESSVACSVEIQVDQSSEVQYADNENPMFITENTKCIDTEQMNTVENADVVIGIQSENSTLKIDQLNFLNAEMQTDESSAVNGIETGKAIRNDNISVNVDNAGYTKPKVV